nr:MAG TPA: hypothetical protein [Bacteriophage sp.]
MLSKQVYRPTLNLTYKAKMPEANKYRENMPLDQQKHLI